MKYVALLRGSNVGGNSKVEMPKLKKLFEDLGYENVSTYINSGNVIFETRETSHEKILKQIDKTLQKNFKFEIKTIVRDSKNILNLIKEIPAKYQNDTEQKTDILFLWKEFDNKNSLKLLEIVDGVDNLDYVDGAIIWNIKRSEYNKSGMHKFIGTQIYKNMTARNINTVRKLATLLENN